MKIETPIKIYAAIFILFQIFSSFFPSHFNWGVHFFAFQDDLFRIIYLLIAIALFFDSLREKILKSINSILKKIKNTNIKAIPFLITILILAIVSITLPVKTHLLGDGALLLREISNIWMADEIPPAFNHQFLVGITINLIRNFIQIKSLDEAIAFYRYYDFVAGIILITLVFYLFKSLKLKPVEKVLLGVIILCSAGIQLFIGYVENYVFLYVSITALMITGWLTLENKLNIIVPILVFIIAIGFHISSISFLPAFLFLIYEKIKINKNLLWIILGAIAGIIIIVLLFLRNKFLYVLDQAILESRWSFLPLSSTKNYFSYTIFSIYHIIDWLNANLLLAPFGLFISICIILIFRKEINRKDSVFIFLTIASVFGLVFTFITHFALGMARDWDFMASFFVPLLFLNVYLIWKINQLNSLSNIVVLFSSLIMLHTSSWLLVNADEQKAINRMSLLNNKKLLGRIPQLNYYETLGSFYYWKSDYVKAKEYFEKYILIESGNPRILGNMAAIYMKLRDNENTFRILKKAALANSPNPGVYINLGVEYSRRGDTSNALKCYLKAIEMDSTRSKAYANMASLFMNQKKYELARENYLKALNLGLNDPIIYRELGYVSYYLKEYQFAVQYFEHYLKFKPDDENAKFMRDNLLLLLNHTESENK